MSLFSVESRERKCQTDLSVRSGVDLRRPGRTGAATDYGGSTTRTSTTEEGLRPGGGDDESCGRRSCTDLLLATQRSLSVRGRYLLVLSTASPGSTPSPPETVDRRPTLKTYSGSQGRASKVTDLLLTIYRQPVENLLSVVINKIDF